MEVPLVISLILNCILIYGMFRITNLASDAIDEGQDNIQELQNEIKTLKNKLNILEGI